MFVFLFLITWIEGFIWVGAALKLWNHIIAPHFGIPHANWLVGWAALLLITFAKSTPTAASEDDAAERVSNSVTLTLMFWVIASVVVWWFT